MNSGYCVALQVNHVIFFWKRFVYLWAVVKDQHPIQKRIESLGEMAQIMSTVSCSSQEKETAADLYVGNI